jgi:GNAT superfamily N-acetyltransferase
MKNGMINRINWIKKMNPFGLDLLIAIEKPKNEIIHYKWVGKIKHSDLAVYNDVPMGLLEYIPIKHALEPVDGENSLFINCMWILPPFWNKGVGSELMNAFIDEANKLGGGSVITYDGDKWFETSINYMPSNFFKKFGFKEVDRDGTRVLLFLDLGNNNKPKLISPEKKSYKLKDKISLEIFFNSQCPWSEFMVNSIKNEMKNYPYIDFSFINTNERHVIEKYGISRGIRVNGKPLITRMATWKEIKTEIDKFVA